ncbi:hypothetical protein [Burkholderia cepacia]|uniref:hypothetical protein n=1 Tax=Burkholderia cepacia TaxID=292 RepID=UPI000755CEED|nr:hypothetical protein [Burkholderia cepacia]KVH35270.1 hypothetical protein WS88_19775 [Burkholderia cepacia]
MTMRRTCTWRLLEDLDRFTDRFVATRGGSKSKPGAFQVTSTFGQTISRLVFMPCRSISALANMWERRASGTDVSNGARPPKTRPSTALFPFHAAQAVPLLACLRNDRKRKQRLGSSIPARPAPRTIDRARAGASIGALDLREIELPAAACGAASIE